MSKKGVVGSTGNTMPATPLARDRAPRAKHLRLRSGMRLSLDFYGPVSTATDLRNPLLGVSYSVICSRSHSRRSSITSFWFISFKSSCLASGYIFILTLVMPFFLS